MTIGSDMLDNNDENEDKENSKQPDQEKQPDEEPQENILHYSKRIIYISHGITI